MFKTRFQPKASALCATGTLLVLGGFLSLNLAGCGGGGNGLGVPSATTTPTVASTGLSLQLYLADGTTASSGGTVTLTSASRTITGTANKSGMVRLSNVAAGVYTVVFTTVDANSVRVSTTRSLTITPPTGTGLRLQFFSLIQGNTGDPTDTAANPFTVSGTVFLNPRDASNNISPLSMCASNPEPVTDQIVVQVKDLNATNGQPIIAQATLTAQNPNLTAPASGTTATRANTPGFYSINIPYQPRNFQVIVSQGADAPFAGVSAQATFASGTAVTGLDICANQSNTAPTAGAQPTPTFIPTTVPTASGTAAGTAVGTAAGTAVGTAAGTAVGTAAGTAVGTAAGTAVGTAAGTAVGTAAGTAVGTAAGTAVGTAAGTASGTAVQ